MYFLELYSVTEAVQNMKCICPIDTLLTKIWMLISITLS